MPDPDVLGLDEVVDLVLPDMREAAYLTISDRTNRKSEVQIGRLDVDAASFAPWVDDELIQNGEPQFEAILDLDLDYIERAIYRWLLSTALDHAGSSDLSKYRVRAYAVKGYRTLASGCFEVVQHQDQVEPEVEPLALTPHCETTPPSKTADEVWHEMEVRSARVGMEALGQHYAQFGALLLSSMRHTHQIHRETIDGLHDQADDGRKHVTELLDALVQLRTAASERDSQATAEARRDQQRAALAQQAISGFVNAAHVFAPGRPAAPQETK